MHKALYAKNGDLKHSDECKMAFGRKDKDCPRCLELLNGSAARKSWHGSYYAQHKQDLNRINEHFASAEHTSGKCGSVCTYGDF